MLYVYGQAINIDQGLILICGIKFELVFPSQVDNQAMHRYIYNLFRKTQEKILLGRWERTDMVQNRIKIDWANTDHCGTCGYTSVPKSKEGALIKYPKDAQITVLKRTYFL